MSTLGLLFLSGARSQHAHASTHTVLVHYHARATLLDVALPSGGRALCSHGSTALTTLAHKYKYDVMSRTHPRTPEG